jgi:exosortase E/protease (VPEID-CTERM system)
VHISATQGPAPIRLAAVASLAVAQILALDALYDVRRFATTTQWLVANDVIKHALYTLIYAAAIFVILIWRDRAEIFGALSGNAVDLRGPLVLNGVSFCTAFSVILLARDADALLSGPWTLLAFAAVATTVMILAALATAPRALWMLLWARHRAAIMAAFGLAMLMSAASVGARESWTLWSDATFRISGALLALMTDGAFGDPAARILGARDFAVTIAPHCAGYEGVGLVSSFLAIYLFAFRRELRFPHALILIPLAAAAAWFLNALRIALLVMIGAHVSPDVAIGGFHSQAGWIMFLTTAFAAMALSHSLPVFRRITTSPPSRSIGSGPAAPYIGPLAAVLCAGLLAQTFSADLNLLGAPLALAFGGATLWAFRKQYGPVHRPTALAILVGAAIGGVWAITEPAATAPNAFAHWAETTPPALVAAYLVVRIAGFALVTPVVEELAFRGYLQRALSAKRFESIPIGTLTMVGVVGSSLAFAALHERWLSAAIAGALYALLASRGTRLTDAVAAHIASNAAIAIIAFSTNDLSLI